MPLPNQTVLALLAHPDDAEFTCAGTLALLHLREWEVHIATMTPGQCGSAELPPDQISAIRREEAKEAAAILDGHYHCLEREDCFVRQDRETVLAALALVRRIQPAIIFVHSPTDYICDHEAASLIGRDAAFFAGVPNIATPEISPFSPVPHLYYVDPIEGKDQFGATVIPEFTVDIGSVIDAKETMLVCHASQREWLMKHHGMDEYTAAMKTMSAGRGELSGCDYAEGFRQHLGHGFPQDNILASELGTQVHSIKTTS